MHDEVREMICNGMGVKNIVMSHMKYLGLPIVFERLKKDIFALAIERVWKKIKG